MNIVHIILREEAELAKRSLNVIVKNLKMEEGQCELRGWTEGKGNCLCRRFLRWQDPQARPRLKPPLTRPSNKGMHMVVRAEMNDPKRRMTSEELVDPYGPVEEVMTQFVYTVGPDEPLEKVLPLLAKYTGLPVVDKEGHCVGVISEKDVMRFVRGENNCSIRDPVSKAMTSPAIVIKERAPIIFAAGLMLQHKVFRLPVVDKQNKVVGIVSRQDLFMPLIDTGKVNPLYHSDVEKPESSNWS
eukprot:jgi/Mesvir1/28414/Mv13856-RA.1